MPGDSRAVYVIICSTRIEVALAKTYDDKVVGAAHGAADFAAFMETAYGDQEDFATDLAPVTKIQHALMNHAIGKHSLGHEQLDQKFIDLFAAMSQMEGEYS